MSVNRRPQRISQMQFGIIDEVYMNSIVSAVNEFNDMKGSLDRLISASTIKKSIPFLAEIETRTQMTTVEIERSNGDEEEVVVAWYYGWKTVKVTNVDTSSGVSFGSADTFFTDYDVRSSTGVPDSGYCFNLAELRNVQTYDEDGTIFGVNVSSEAYPTGFFPVGVPEKAVVLLQRAVSDEGQVLYVFDRQGTHDGTCPT